MIGTYFGITFWAGSAFNCPLREIVLLHRLFPENVYGECNTGSITGRSLSVHTKNGTYYYTSQLNVTISSGVIGKSVECYYDGNTGMTSQLIGGLNITLISG